MLVVLNLKNFE
jgi:preprotein translocase subunit SecG